MVILNLSEELQHELSTTLVQTNNYSYYKSQLSLPRNFAGHKATVVKIVARGNVKIGITYQPIVTFKVIRCEIDVENAIASGEIIVPDEFKFMHKITKTVEEVKPQISLADELTKINKLYDDGVATKDEFETLKKFFLDKN